MKKTVLAFSAAMLWCASALAMLPVEGIYEKVDAEGNVVARLQCWDAFGSVGREGQEWANSSCAPYISLQSFKNGTEVKQVATCYIGKTPDTGAGEYAVVLNKEECQKVIDYNEISGERMRDVAAFTWKNENEVSVGAYNFDDSLSGDYKRVDKLRKLPISMLMFAYEKNQHPQFYFVGASKPSLTYSMAEVHGPFALQAFNIYDRQAGMDMHFYAENDFNLIMEADGIGGRDFYFPFIHKNLLNRTRDTWGPINDPGNFTEGAVIATLRKLMANESYAGLLPGSSGCIRYKDFYSGEGPNARSTHRMSVVEPLVEKGWLEKGIIDYNDNGSMRVQNFTGRATVNGTEIRFRDGASSSAAIIGEMQNGEAVQCMGYIASPDHNWAYITRNNGESGFMAMEYLQGIEKP